MKASSKKYFKLLWRYVGPQWPRILLLVTTLGGSVAIKLINPQVLRFIIDSAVAGKPAQILVQAAVLFIGIALLNQIFITISTYIGQNVGWVATNALRTDLITHCIKLDMSFHKSYHQGELIERIDGDTSELFNFFSKLVLDIFNNLILIIGILVLLFRENWLAGIGLSVFAMFTVYIFFHIQSIAVPYWVSVREKSAEFFGFVGEQVSGTEDLRSSGSTEYIMYKFYQHIKGWLPATLKAKMMNYTLWAITIGVFALGNILAFGLGGYLWKEGLITIGTVYLIFNYTELIRGPIEQLKTQFDDLQKAGGSLARINELFLIESKLVITGKVLISEGALDVSINNLSFSYNGEDMVLKDIEIRLAPGKQLGIIGRTGSGKTTLARLVTRLYDPDNGEILIGGINIKEVQLNNIRQRIAYVTQDVQLFNATLRDNLTFFDREISDKSILETLEDVGLGNWYKQLPKGLDTVLEAGGGGLSAGEAQLLAFIRAFLKNPGLVILDEASSRLDPATELLIGSAVNKLLKGRTAIIIAHRLQTLENVDEIVILDKGGIIEYGQYEKLRSDISSRFYGMLQTGMEEMLA